MVRTMRYKLVTTIYTCVIMFSASNVLADELKLIIVRNLDDGALSAAHPNWKMAEQFESYETISSEPMNWKPYQKLKKEYSILATHVWPITEDETSIGFKTYDADSVIMGEITLNKQRFYETKLNIIELNKKNYFSLNQSRRIALNQLNYFDHARFGILLQIIPETKKEESNASVS
jgi:hypothetical protein